MPFNIIKGQARRQNDQIMAENEEENYYHFRAGRRGNNICRQRDIAKSETEIRRVQAKQDNIKLAKINLGFNMKASVRVSAPVEPKV